LSLLSKKKIRIHLNNFNQQLINCSNIPTIIAILSNNILLLAFPTVIIERHGLQPDNGTNLNDNSIATCSQFVTDGHQHTQIFQQTICTIDRMSVTLVGQDMKCVDNMYVAGLTGSDVGKAINKWKRCRPRRQTTTDDNLDWCIYECICTGNCEQVMALRWPKKLADSSWTLCDISYHCSGRISVFSFISTN